MRPARAILLLLATGCGWPSLPVPVTGDIQLLAGDWVGEYTSPVTGRGGSITFRLKAGTDSAWGDVVMVANRPELPAGSTGFPDPAVRRLPVLLRISFIRCDDGEVTGRLDAYEDPDTKERVFTTFSGRLTGARFEGTFVSVYAGGGPRAGGEWWVERRRD